MVMIGLLLKFLLVLGLERFYLLLVLLFEFFILFFKVLDSLD